MEIIVDVNVVISSLLSKGEAFKVFAKNYAFHKFDFIAPEFLLTELNKHKSELIKNSKLNRDEFDDVLEFIIEQITFISESQFEDWVEKAKKPLLNHLKDVQYLALAMKLNCPIFSGDKRFKELSPVKVFSPKEMLNKF